MQASAAALEEQDLQQVLEASLVFPNPEDFAPGKEVS
jgi:hypothetical protein